MTELKRGLNFWTALALAIANIMGTGLFFGVSIGASRAGNASIISWVIISVFAVYISMFFAELVSMFPYAGGVYEYSKQVYSRFTSFMIGWIAWIVGNLTIALMIVAAVDYLLPFQVDTYIKILISISIILVLNLVAYFGIQASGIALVLLATLTIGVILSVIVPGFFFVDASNYSPLFPLGFMPVLVVIFFIAESFFGWESSTYLAEETKDPQVTIPKALIIGTIITALFGIGIATVSLGIIPWKEIATSFAPMSEIFGRIYGVDNIPILNFGVFIALIGSAAGGIVGLPRLLLGLSRDKLFIGQLSRIHPVFKTPYKAILFQTVITLGVYFMVLGNYRVLLSLLVPLGIIMYIAIIFTVPILRHKKPLVIRPFRVPFGKLGSILVILFLISIVTIWIITEPNAIKIIFVGFSLVFIGFPIYILLMFYYDPDAIIKVNNALAYFTLLSERIILPVKIRKEIIRLLGDVKGKNILEFGCSVGTLTMDLADKVQSHGRLYATDLSKNEIVITKKRLTKKGHMQVTLIHDEHQVNRVHPDIPKVDAIVSMGMMGYMQDVKKVLKEMNSLLPERGNIVFVDYVDFFKVIPNVEWLSDNKIIEKLFRECGFSVHVERKKGILWNYVFVYGIKHAKDIPFI